MNFYYAYYKRQYYNEHMGLWKDTDYDHQSIIVLANTYDEAKSKIEKCVAAVEHGNYRAVLVSDITECIGLDGRHEFEGSFGLYPILSD